jgi:hypothetical protein
MKLKTLLVRWKACSPHLAPFALFAQLYSQFSEHFLFQQYSYQLFSEQPVMKGIFKTINCPPKELNYFQ